MPYLTEESIENLKHICIKCYETVEQLHYNRLCDNCYKPNNDFGLNKTLNDYTNNYEKKHKNPFNSWTY